MASRERSPNYPGMGLDAAVQMLRKLYESEHRAAVPAEVAARALGHSGVSEKGRLSGPALAKLAALRQYGLIENAGKGKIKVSDDALDFTLHGPDEPEYRKAAQSAALAPPLFADLYGEYAKASDNALRAHLIKERQFSTEGASRLIKAFRDTLAFAKLDGSSYNGGGGAGEGERKEPPTKPPAGTGSTGFPPRQSPKPSGTSNVAYSWPLGDGNKVELAFAEEPTRKAVDRLIAYLQLMRENVPEKLEMTEEKPGEGRE